MFAAPSKAEVRIHVFVFLDIKVCLNHLISFNAPAGHKLDFTFLAVMILSTLQI